MWRENVFFPSGKKIVAFFLSWKKVQIGGREKWPIVCCLAISLWLFCGPRIKNFRALKILRDFFPTWKKSGFLVAVGAARLAVFWSFSGAWRRGFVARFLGAGFVSAWVLGGRSRVCGAVLVRCGCAAVPPLLIFAPCVEWWWRWWCVARGGCVACVWRARAGGGCAVAAGCVCCFGFGVVGLFGCAFALCGSLLPLVVRVRLAAAWRRRARSAF
jgi:hypothetical protein